MAATVLAMSAESSVLEEAWNCLNADRAGQGADTSRTKLGCHPERSEGSACRL